MNNAELGGTLTFYTEKQMIHTDLTLGKVYDWQSLSSVPTYAQLGPASLLSVHLSSSARAAF